MEEILDVVDKTDKFVRKATRKEVMEKALMHRDSRVVIENSKGEFLVQKRSMNKDTYPEHWDIGVAETVKSGESYEGAAMRGLVEEVGIIGISNIQLIHSLLFKIKYNSPKTNEHVKVYKIFYDGKLTIQKEEIDETKFLTKEDVTNLIEKLPFHPVGNMVFERYLEMKQNKIL